MPKALTIKQERFCDKYIECGNASEAYRFAYSCGNRKERTIWIEASRLLDNPNVALRISEMQAQMRTKAEITKERILEEHSKIAFSSIAHLHRTWIERVEFEQLSADQKASIKSISTRVEKRNTPSGDIAEVEFVKIELYDKQKALDSLTKMLGYDLPTKIELKGNEPVVVEVIDSRDKVDNENTGK